jgi:RNA polymerase sigma factor (sigma-70 family)
MAEQPPGSLLHHLRHLVGSVPEAALTDSQLLKQFVDERDEAAVEVLVRRHGPLVFGVCRRVLRNVHAAEDAFQATFLILTRKAPSLMCRERLGSWLYKIAYRVALRARANDMRRQQHETQAARRHAAEVCGGSRSGDLVVALEEELQRLPARHRDPLVLCYFQGKTNQEAAQALGCPEGSISARLSQARERLRKCLTRRGCVMSAAGLAALLGTAAAEAVVPLPLLTNTIATALWFARENAFSAATVSVEAVALARGAVRTMFLHKLQLAAGVLLAAAMLGTGATMWLRGATQTSGPVQERAERPGASPADVAEVAEQGLPAGAVARMGLTRLRHGDAVSVAAYLPDGKNLVTAGRDKTVRLWDLNTGQEIRRFHWDEGENAGKLDRAEEDIVSKRLQQFWDDTARSCQAAVSADGKLVAGSRGSEVCLWETATGKQLHQFDTGQKRLLQLVFAADGKRLLSLGAGGATAIWDVATAKCIRRSPGKSLPQYLGGIIQVSMHNIVVSPNLKYVASTRRDDNGTDWVDIKDLSTDQPTPRIQSAHGLTLAFSADDKTVYWQRSDQDCVVVADVASGREQRVLKSVGINGSQTSIDVILALAVSRDGQRLAASWMSHTIEVWDLKSGKSILPVGKATPDQYDQQSTNFFDYLVRPALAFSPDGKKLVASLGGALVRQFDCDTGTEVPAPDAGQRGPVSTLVLSTEGQTLWTHSPGDPIRYWNWRTGRKTGQREVPATASHVALAADGRFAYAVGPEYTLASADGKQVRKIHAENSQLDAFAMSPDGAFLATRGHLKRNIQLWDTTTLKIAHVLGRAGDNPPGGAVTETTGVLTPGIVFSPDGRWLAAAGPNWQLCVWNVAKGSLLWELPLPVGQAIARFAFSQNSRVLAAVQADRTVVLYEVVSGTQRVRLGDPDVKHRRVYLTDGSRSVADVQMRSQAPVCLAFSPDSRYLAVAQETPEIHLWDIGAGRELGRLTGNQGGVVSLLFTAEGKHLVSGSTDTSALTWDLTRLLRSNSSSSAELSKGILEEQWTDLAARDAPRAFAAIRKLGATPSQALGLFRERVRPATPADPHQLAGLLANLDSDRFALRRQAQAELEALGDLAEPALRKALAGDCSLELRQRLEQLLDKLAGQAPVAGKLRDLRAVELLEWIGGSEARQLLQVLAEGAPQARLTQEARSAIRRLTKASTTS